MKDIIEYILAILITGCVLGTLFPIVLILMLLSILELYNDIIDELSHVEELVNYYKNK